MGMFNHMPSPQLLIGRRSIVGNVYAITMICRDRRLIFEDPTNASIAMQALEAMDQQGLTSSLAWVVMPDHLHWLAQLREKVTRLLHSALQVTQRSAHQPPSKKRRGCLAGGLLRPCDPQ